MPARKFYFTQVKDIKGKRPGVGNGFLSVDCKTGRARFSKNAMNLFKDKFYKLYADKSKRAIAWSVFEEGSLKDLNSFRQFTVFVSNKTSEKRAPFKNMIISIRSVLDQLNIKEGSYLGLPIQEYFDNEMGQKFYYVILEK